ncbi:MAG: TCR/Tet family MFS transporter [Planctomycetes bacterium]|nr:TCR/Tet family MFS transporter [Planctomycetota bacterium]
MTSRTPALSFIFFTLLLDVLGFGLLIPVGPHLIEELQGDPDGAGRTVGWLNATYAAMLFLFSPILGALSDRFGRRPVLLVALFGSGLDYLVMALVPSVPWLFVTRVVNGLSGATITVANAYIADVTPPDRRAAGFGIVGAAFGLGFVLGPALGGWLGGYDIRYPFYAASAITMCNWLYGLLILPESLPPERRATGGFRYDPLAGLRNLSISPLVARFAAALFLLNAAQFALHATWVLYTKNRYDWGPRGAGWSLFAVGIGAALVQGGLARRLIPRLGERRSVLLGTAIGAVAFVGYGSATEGWMVYLVIALASLGGISMPACQSLISKSVRPDQQGTVQGALTAVQGLANIAGPLIGGYVFEWSIDLKPPLPGLTFYTSAALAAVGWLIFAVALRRRDTPSS